MPRGNYTGVLLTEKCVNDMTEKEWLDARKHGSKGDRDFCIGGSDVGTVLGVNPYKSPLELYNEKLGINAFKENNEEIFERGHFWEETIARLLEKDLKEEYGNDNVEVKFDKYMYGCGEKDENGNLKYPYMVINYDCYVRIRIDGIWHLYLGEIKTTSSNNYELHKKWKAGIVPATYDYQTRYYMKGLNVDGCFIMCAWGLDKADRAYVFIKRDYDIEDEIMEACDTFIYGLRNNIPPDSDDTPAETMNSYYSRLYGEIPSVASSPVFEIGDTYASAIKKLMQADSELVTLDKRKKEWNKCVKRPFMKSSLCLKIHPEAFIK